MSGTAKTSELPSWIIRQGLTDAIVESTYSKDPDEHDKVGCAIYEILVGQGLFATRLWGCGCNHTLDGSPLRGDNGKAAPHVVHAETAALASAPRWFKEPKPYLVAFLTKEPCLNCLVQLAANGIRQIHFIHPVPDHKSGRHLLQHFPMIEEYRQNESLL